MPDRERKRVPDDRSDILKGSLPKRESTMGLGHNGTGTRWGWDIMGLGHDGAGTKGDESEVSV